jgi:hypothetical protein
MKANVGHSFFQKRDHIVVLTSKTFEQVCLLVYEPSSGSGSRAAEGHVVKVGMLPLKVEHGHTIKVMISLTYRDHPLMDALIYLWMSSMEIEHVTMKNGKRKDLCP